MVCVCVCVRARMRVHVRCVCVYSLSSQDGGGVQYLKISYFLTNFWITFLE